MLAMLAGVATLRATAAPFRPAIRSLLPSALPPAPPLPPLHASAYLITEAGTPLAGQNIHLLHPTASTVKLLTALVAAHDPSLRPDRVITASAAEVQRTQLGYAQGDSELSLHVGERLTVHDLLLALLLPSADNAADMLAAASSGGTQGFLAAMHRASERIGLGSPAFGDASGLSARNQFSPAGAVRLAQAALRDPLVASIIRLRSARLSNGQVVRNLNQLLTTYPGAIGLKTGYTPTAGYMLVFAAERHGRTVIGSLMGEPSMRQVFADARALLNWGFAAAQARTLRAGTQVAILTWPDGARQVLRLRRAITLPWASDTALRHSLRLRSPGALAAGGEVGELFVQVPGRASAASTLVAPGLGTWPRLLARLLP